MPSPCKRIDGLVAASFGAEMIVYDERTNQAHCLSQDAMIVWEACDGVRSPDAIGEHTGLTLEQVAAAVMELDRCSLLEDGAHWGPLFDRRGLLVRAAVLSVPLITSAAVYPALAHASTVSPPVPVFTLIATTQSYPGSLAFSPDGKLLAIGDVNQVTAYPITLGTSDSIDTSTPTVITGLDNVASVAFSGDGKLLALINYNDLSVLVYPVTLGATDADPDTLATTASATITGLSNPASLAFSPDGKLLAVANSGTNDLAPRPVQVYDVTLGSTANDPDTVNTTAASTDSVLVGTVDSAFSPDGKLLAVTQTNSVALFAVTLGSPDTVAANATYVQPLDRPRGVTFSLDGKLMAVANNFAGTVTVYSVTLGSTNSDPDTVTTTAAVTITGLDYPTSVAFSPDGTLLAVANESSSPSPGSVTVYPVAAGSTPPVSTTAVATITDLEYPTTVAFSPDGKLLAVAASSTSTLKVYAVS